MSDVITTYNCPKHGPIKFTGYPPDMVPECRLCKDEALATNLRDTCPHNGTWVSIDYYFSTKVQPAEAIGIRMCTFCGKFESSIIPLIGAF